MGHPNPQESIEDSILTASRIMVNILAESLMYELEDQVTVPQFRILDMIKNLTNKPAEIARMLDVSPPAISFLLEKLEEKSLLKREMNKADRRRVELVLTSKGADFVKRVNDRRRKSLKLVLRHMDEAALSQLEESLTAFTDSYFRLKHKEDKGSNA